MDPRPSNPASRPTIPRPPGAAVAHAPHSFLDPPQQPDEIGRLGPYRVLGELGRGGMGVVYRAEDPRLRRLIAIKVLLPELSADARAKARFVREARAQAKVEHDHVTPVFHIGEANGLPVIVMPLLKGQTLSAALAQNPHPPVAELIRIGREIAEGLAAAHAVGLIHRDIKPGNVWLEGARRRVKILDFGLSRGADPTAGQSELITAAGAIMGTPSYMAPEQARSQPVDHRADLFSLGVVLYQMATGQLPFTGPSAFDVMAAVVTHEPPSVEAVVPDLRPELSALVRRLLAKDPAARLQTAEAVAEELGAIEQSLTAFPVRVVPLTALPGAPAVPDPWAEIDTTHDDEVVHKTRAATPRARRAGAPKWLWPAVAVLGVVGFVAIVSVTVPWWKPKPKTETVEEPKPPVVPVPKTKGDDNPKPIASPDRAAAETLRKHRFALEVRTPDGKQRAIAPADPLPTGPFEITDCNPPKEPLPADFWQAVLIPTVGNLPKLKGILDHAMTTAWTEGDLARLAAAPVAADLMALRAGFELTPKNLETLKRFPKLEDVGCRVGPNSVPARLKELPNLDWLVLHAPKDKTHALRANDWTGVHGEQLIGLELYRIELDETGTKQIAGMTRLESLGLIDCPQMSARLPALAANRSLLELNLIGELADADLKALHACGHLRRLTIGSTNVTEPGAKALADKLPTCRIEWGAGKVIEPKAKP